MTKAKLAPVKNYPGYFINRKGEVYSTISNGHRGQLRRLGTSVNLGYHRVALAYGPKGHRRIRLITVHTLVLETFVGPRPDGYEARHLDGVRGNNNLSNLKWGTKEENTADRMRHGHQVYGVNHPDARLNPRKVMMIRERYLRGESMASIARHYGVIGPSIKAIMYGKSWIHVPIDAKTAAALKKRLAGNGVGEKNFHAKLTEKDVRAIRKRYAVGDVSIGQLAREYGFSTFGMSCVVHRKTWKHVG